MINAMYTSGKMAVSITESLSFNCYQILNPSILQFTTYFLRLKTFDWER